MHAERGRRPGPQQPLEELGDAVVDGLIADGRHQGKAADLAGRILLAQQVGFHRQRRHGCGAAGIAGGTRGCDRRCGAGDAGRAGCCAPVSYSAALRAGRSGVWPRPLPQATPLWPGGARGLRCRGSVNRETLFAPKVMPPIFLRGSYSSYREPDATVR